MTRLAPDLILDVSPDPTNTAATWVQRVDPLELDWSGALLGCLQNRIEGLFADALRIAGWDEVAPPSVSSTLSRRAELFEARHQAHYYALREINDREPDLISRSILLKGAVLGSVYASTSHRPIGDYDLLFREADAEVVHDVFLGLGYWEKSGKNGPTYFRDVEDRVPGCDYVGFDIHYDVPTKYSRDARTIVAEVWQRESRPYQLGEIAALAASPALQVVNLLVHAHEHAASWLHVILDDDVRLLRFLDIELLCATEDVEASEVRRLAEELGVENHAAIGVAMLEELRGHVPKSLSGFDDLLPRARIASREVALPDGRIESMALAMPERLLNLDRCADALRMMPVEHRSRRVWFDWRKGLLSGAEPVGAIADQVTRMSGSGGDAH